MTKASQTATATYKAIPTELEQTCGQWTVHSAAAKAEWCQGSQHVPDLHCTSSIASLRISYQVPHYLWFWNLATVYNTESNQILILIWQPAAQIKIMYMILYQTCLGNYQRELSQLSPAHILATAWKQDIIRKFWTYGNNPLYTCYSYTMVLGIYGSKPTKHEGEVWFTLP